MTTLSSLSKILFALTFVTVGAVGTAEAAPTAQRAVWAKTAPSAIRANRPVQAQRGNRPIAHALNRPMVVAQAEAPVVKAKKFNRKERHAERIAKFDTNKNGQIDAPERLAMQKARFEELDANGDKAITLAEMQAAKEAQRQKRANKRAMHSGKEGKEHMGRKGKGKDHGKRGEARFAKFDSDGNGSVSWQEFLTAKEKGQGPMGEGHGPRGEGPGKRRGRY